jgi:hypothetical protein
MSSPRRSCAWGLPQRRHRARLCTPRHRTARTLALAALALLVAGAAAQCADNAVDVSAAGSPGTNCSCNYGYAGNGLIACDACEPGKATQTMGAELCITCDPGSFSVGPQRGCTGCRGGSFAPAAGASACTNCTAGQFSLRSATVCTDCPQGTYTEAKVGTSSACSECPAGTASAQVAATTRQTCKNCSAGSFAEEASAACSDCIAGKYSEFRASACMSCALGKFSSAAGTSTGTVIQNGRFVELLAADSESVCTWCSAGFYGGRLAAAACTACPKGKYSYDSGIYLSLAFDATMNVATVCTDCSVGKASNFSGAKANNETVCETCRKGTWAAEGFAICTECVPGKFGNSTGARSPLLCDECAAGRFAASGQARCSDCRMGTYSLGSASVCSDCSAGTASDLEGLEANSKSVCLECAEGNFSTAGSAYCLRCRPGTYSDQSRSSACTKCELGFYQPDFSQTSCIECPINTYANSTGLSSCFACPPDLFSRSGSIAKVDCRTAQIEVSPSDANWGPIIEAAPKFAMIFLRPGNYTGYCNLRVNAVKLEGIMGKDNTIIDCEGKQRHFSIDGTRNITLIGITLKNGYSGSEEGGCVTITRGVLTLVQSRLENCRSDNSGGAMHVSMRSLLDVRSSTFVDCFSGGNGGCVTIKNSTVNAVGSTFKNGRSLRVGGAIYLEDISDLDVSGCAISGCSALGGGGMSFEGVKITAVISSVRFIDNVATSTDDGLLSGGGAILVLDNTNVMLHNCIFMDNMANYSGGALRIDTDSSMSADSSEFLRNTARLYGGCMRVGSGSRFSGHGNFFDTNWGHRSAGVIAYSDASAGGSLSESKFLFDPNQGCLGCPESNTQNFAVCLRGTADAQPGDQSQAFLQQPCFECEDAKCWGVHQVSACLHL